MTTKLSLRRNARAAASPLVAQTVLQEVSGRLFDGVYGPQARLPAERELAHELGASRVSVRAALQRLESWRMLDVRHGSGAAVRPRRHWSFSALPALMRHAVQRGDAEALVQVVRESLQLRRLLITEVVCGQARRLRPGALDAARDEVRLAFAAREDFPAFLRHDLELSRRVLEAHALLLPLWLLNSVADAYLDLVTAFPVQPPVPPDYQTTHLRLLDALEVGNRKRARALAAGYLERHDARILSTLEAL